MCFIEYIRINTREFDARSFLGIAPCSAQHLSHENTLNNTNYRRSANYSCFTQKLVNEEAFCCCIFHVLAFSSALPIFSLVFRISRIISLFAFTMFLVYFYSYFVQILPQFLPSLSLFAFHSHFFSLSPLCSLFSLCRYAETKQLRTQLLTPRSLIIKL